MFPKAITAPSIPTQNNIFLDICLNFTKDVIDCNLDKVQERPWQKDIAPRFPEPAEIFEERVRELVGSAYTVTGSFTNYKTKIAIRHNSCGQTQEYYPYNYLHGQRCKHCWIPLTADYLRAVIPQLSYGNYIYGGSPKKNMIQIIDAKSNAEIIMRPEYALQELTRPTPSSILPQAIELQSESHEQTQKVIPYRRHDIFWNMLQDRYCDEKFIFLDEYAYDPDICKSAKHTFEHFVNYLFLKRVAPGIYAWLRADYTIEELLVAKYCKRKNSNIGYSYGQSFAFEVGLSSQAPDMLYLTTNKESKLHGRTIQFKGTSAHIRGSKVLVTNENFKILQLLDMLPNLGKYISCSRDEALSILRSYAFREGLSHADAAPHLHLYPTWVSPILDQILSDE